MSGTGKIVSHNIVTNLEDNFPNCNIIGIRLLQSGEVSRFHYQYKEDENYTDQDKKSWSKTKSAILKPTGYSVLYGIASSSMNSSEEFEVKENATKAQIRSAFKKNLKTKVVIRKCFHPLLTWLHNQLINCHTWGSNYSMYPLQCIHS